MPDLETLLRDVKPAPDPAWALRLDSRVAHGFPGPPPRWRRPFIAVREHLLVLGTVAAVASVLVLVVTAGLPQVGGDDEPASGGSGGGSTAFVEESERKTTASGGSDESGGGSEDSAGRASPRAALPTAAPEAAMLQADRAVKTNASLTLSTAPREVPRLTDRSIAVVDALGGYVQSSQVDQNGNRAASATLSLRIPSGRLEDGLARLSKLAHVKARSQQTEDLTDVREALEAAVRDARADRAGLRARLAKATTDKERSRLRAALDRATRRVTQRQREVNELGHEVSYATVDLQIDGDRRSGAAPAGGRWTPGDAVGDAVRVLEVIAGVLVIALAVALPIAALAALAAFASRVLTRRRRERALEAA